VAPLRVDGEVLGGYCASSWWEIARAVVRSSLIALKPVRSNLSEVMITMKKLINEPPDVVSEALRGMAAVHPELRIDHQNRIIYRADAPVTGKVGLVSGGGSGHEPLHGGLGLTMMSCTCGTRP
jgi:hypothetical protein